MMNNNELKVRKAVTGDLDSIGKVLDNCRIHLDEQGIPQWVPEYPSLIHIEEDIKNETAFVAEFNQKNVAYIVINDFQDPEYKNIKWNYHGDKVFVIHRLAVDPTYQNMGIARQIMDFAENYSLESGIEVIRLDAFTLNKRVLRFYEKRGYQNCGETYFPYRDYPFNCYEKFLI